MQLFRSEEDVVAWSTETEIPTGAVFDTQQLWNLARRWYDDRFDINWRRRSVQERQAILTDAGLTGSFWRLAV